MLQWTLMGFGTSFIKGKLLLEDQKKKITHKLISNHVCKRSHQQDCLHKSQHLSVGRLSMILLIEPIKISPFHFLLGLRSSVLPTVLFKVEECFKRKKKIRFHMSSQPLPTDTDSGSFNWKWVTLSISFIFFFLCYPISPYFKK